MCGWRGAGRWVQQRGWGGGRGMVMWQWGGDMCVCGIGALDMHVVGEEDEEWGVERTEVV